MSAELFSRYDRLLLQLSLDQMSDIIYCPRKMCGAAVLLDSDSQMAECSVCRYVFCKLCRAVYHGVNNCAMNPGLVSTSSGLSNFLGLMSNGISFVSLCCKALPRLLYISNGVDLMSDSWLINTVDYW